MKFNLKNRPQRRSTMKLYEDDEVDEWFEGFEKELRAIIRREQEPEQCFAKGMCKEILGE